MQLVGKDASFLEINNELADKGFFVTSTDRRTDCLGADRVDLLGEPLGWLAVRWK